MGLFWARPLTLSSAPTSSFSTLVIGKLSNFVIENPGAFGGNYSITKFPDYPISLPPVMGKRLIGFRHAVHVFLLLDGSSAAVGRVEQLVSPLVNHSFFATSAGIGNQPANRQRSAPVRIHFDRHLIVGATHAAGLDLEQRLGIL